MREPVLGRDVGAADVLGARVVLVDDRAPPVQHLALDGHGARRGGVHDEVQARQVVAGPLGRGQAEQAHEHRRHELRVGHPVALDQLEAPPGIEPLHHHDRGSQALHRHRVDERRRVVERRGAQVDGALADAAALGGQRAGEQHRCGRRVAERRARQVLAHALGPPGGAGRVQHLPALALVVGRERLRRGEHVVVALEARQVAHPRHPHRDAGQVEAGHDVGHRLGRHQRDRTAVVEHVLHLAGAQVAVDRRVPEPRPLRRPRHLEERPVVLHQHGDVVAGADAAGPQRPGQATGAVVQLGVGHDLARVRHDEGGRVGRVVRVPGRRQLFHGSPSSVSPGGSVPVAAESWFSRS